jgi:hypothetical protein
MKTIDALEFVKHHGIVLQAARGPVPSLAEAIAGEPIRGSWWGHPRGQDIFEASRLISDSPDVLVCKLIDGKVTFVHRRLWPALVRLASRLPKDRLSRIREEQTASGAHRLRREVFPAWVPSDVMEESKRLSMAQAEKILSEWLYPKEGKTLD